MTHINTLQGGHGQKWDRSEKLILFTVIFFWSLTTRAGYQTTLLLNRGLDCVYSTDLSSEKLLNSNWVWSDSQSSFSDTEMYIFCKVRYWTTSIFWYWNYDILKLLVLVLCQNPFPCLFGFLLALNWTQPVMSAMPDHNLNINLNWARSTKGGAERDTI